MGAPNSAVHLPSAAEAAAHWTRSELEFALHPESLISRKDDTQFNSFSHHAARMYPSHTSMSTSSLHDALGTGIASDVPGDNPAGHQDRCGPSFESSLMAHEAANLFAVDVNTQMFHTTAYPAMAGIPEVNVDSSYGYYA